MKQYILDNKTPVMEPDCIKWAEWLETANRRVAFTTLEKYRISTIFLGLDHQWGDGPPLLFETMVFPLDTFSDLDCERYSTWEEAEIGHKKLVEKWQGKE